MLSLHPSYYFACTALLYSVSIVIVTIYLIVYLVTLFYYLSFLLESKFHDKFILFSTAVSLTQPQYLVSA